MNNNVGSYKQLTVSNLIQILTVIRTSCYWQRTFQAWRHLVFLRCSRQLGTQVGGIPWSWKTKQVSLKISLSYCDKNTFQREFTWNSLTQHRGRDRSWRPCSVWVEFARKPASWILGAAPRDCRSKSEGRSSNCPWTHSRACLQNPSCRQSKYKWHNTPK